MQQKKQKLIRLIRKQSIQSKIQQYRQKQILSGDLEKVLNNYSKCCLVNGQEESFSHRSYLDCQRFVIESHEDLFQLIQQLSIEQSKELISRHGLAKKLTQVKQFVQNKTLENDENYLQAHLLSKNNVLKSICHLFGLFTQDRDLVLQIREEVIGLFCLQLRRQFPIKKHPEKGWGIPVTGLINMFCYPQAEEQVYYGLNQSNFQLLVQNYFKQLLHFKEITYQSREFSTNVVILLKYYLQYQAQNTQNRPWRKFVSILSTFIVETIRHNINIDRYFHKDVSENQLIDQLLKICIWIDKIQLGQQLQILKNKDLFKKNTYAELLNCWSYGYNLQISLDTFTNDQLFELFQSAKERTGTLDFGKYQNNLVNAIMNMLQEVSDPAVSARRLLSLFQQTKTTHLFADVLSQNGDVKMLGELLDVHAEPDSEQFDVSP